MIYNNNNTQQLKIIPFVGLLLSFLVSILSLSAAQAQQDFDPLLIGESLDLVNSPTGADCRNSRIWLFGCFVCKVCKSSSYC